MKRIAFALLLALVAGCVRPAAVAIELTELQAAHVHECLDNGWNARIFYDGATTEVSCVAAY